MSENARLGTYLALFMLISGLPFLVLLLPQKLLRKWDRRPGSSRLGTRKLRTRSALIALRKFGKKDD
jgi:hypothetical protein